MAGVLDHLWQSLWFAALVGGLAWLTANNLAAIRLWMWRIAALKFLLPFSLLYLLGTWLGFPVRHSAIPPPPVLVEAMRQGLALAAPAQKFAPSLAWLIVGLLAALIAGTVCVAWIFRELRRAARQHDEEVTRISVNWSDRAPPPGFFVTALLTGAVVLTLVAPIVAGAVSDRVWRQEVLRMDTAALRSPKIEMLESDPAIGIFSRMIAVPDGVLIRNINIQDLVALVYGIDQFEVFGGALPWLASPRYDVRVTGPLRAPEVFDPYSLRQPMTEYLAARFGVSIRVNGSCQEPCVNQQSFVIERLH